MKSLIIQFADRHAECVGIVVEYLLRDNPESIDIFLGAKDKNTDTWFNFFKRNFSDIIKLERIDIFPQKAYLYRKAIFLTSSDYLMIDKLNPIIDLIQYVDMGGLVHQYKSGVFRSNYINLAFTPLIAVDQISMKFRYFKEKHNYDNSFYPSIKFFMTGWAEHVDFETINEMFKSWDINCLFISKREKDAVINVGLSNIIFLQNISTDDLLRCFLFKKCIFCPKTGDLYSKERISGCIHLAASFSTKLYLPKDIKEVYSNFDNFCGY
jgi:hypothetical protein